MNNYSLEPKDGDFVALVKKLEKKNLTAIKNDIKRSNANHQSHTQKEALDEMSEIYDSTCVRSHSYEELSSKEDSGSDCKVFSSDENDKCQNDAFNNSDTEQTDLKNEKLSSDKTENLSLYHDTEKTEKKSPSYVSSNISANKNSTNAAKRSSSFSSFLIPAYIFAFFAVIVFSDDPERVISLFVPVFFVLIFFNIFKNKTHKK